MTSVFGLFCWCVASATPTKIVAQPTAPASITKCIGTISKLSGPAGKHRYAIKTVMQIHNKSEKSIAYVRAESVQTTGYGEPVNIVFETFGSLDNNDPTSNASLQSQAYSIDRTNTTTETVEDNSVDNASLKSVSAFVCKLVFVRTIPLEDGGDDWADAP